MRDRSIVAGRALGGTSASGVTPAPGFAPPPGFASIPILVAALLAAGPLAGQSGDDSLGPPIGTSAPSAIVEDLEGNAVDLLDYVAQGRPTLIEFWATWCQICRALQPQLDEIQTRYGDKVSVVAVAVAVSQSAERVRRHVEEHDLGYPFVWDETGAAVRAYNAPATGIIVILDGEGRVAYTGLGVEQDLPSVVERILEGG